METMRRDFNAAGEKPARIVTSLSSHRGNHDDRRQRKRRHSNSMHKLLCSSLLITSYLLLIISYPWVATALLSPGSGDRCGGGLGRHGLSISRRHSSESSSMHQSSSSSQPAPSALSMALGDYSVVLEKPLGLILEEREVGGGGVRIKEIGPDGSAAASPDMIVPGDVLLEVEGTDVSTSDFDTVMDKLIDAPATVHLSLGDGLGTFDMPKNVVKMLKTKEDAFFIDAVVRQAVREIRHNGRLGDLLKVEVIVGAGVQLLQDNQSRGMARFFAIFSTDGVSSYSCNVATTGVQQENGKIQIVSLSCAKDEGLGQTYDLIQETTA